MRTTSRPERHSEHEEGHDERWLITYADMITLL
ncbi:MAG: endoflagellar motor protein, partial [Armatimonadia bacterium]|nr:endoflagellar motor protein [Armatimonadia bacterium]